MTRIARVEKGVDHMTPTMHVLKHPSVIRDRLDLLAFLVIGPWALWVIVSVIMQLVELFHHLVGIVP
jgi:hypothetical protein